MPANDRKLAIQFSLRTLFVCMFLIAFGLGAIRFLADKPELALPLMLVAGMVALLLIPQMVQRFKTRRVRLFLGCLVIPLALLVAGVVIAASAVLLQQVMFWGNPPG